MKHIALLGSTGSIGKQTLDVVRRLPRLLRVVGLAAKSNAEMVAEQALQIGAHAVVLSDPSVRGIAEASLPKSTSISYGSDALELLATREDVDIVVVAVSGAVATRATIAALIAGKTVAIATKEVLVAAGEIAVKAAQLGGGKIIPIDSEHSALFQCLQGNSIDAVDRVWLTGSGGPFRTWSADQIADASVEDALKHPTWRMGKKITVDSATLMNKGLEAIEARWLFDIPLSKIDLVIHPQSLVHAMVRFNDGALLALLGTADMRLPIEYALLYPERIPLDIPRLDPADLPDLTFERPDIDRFPALRLARLAGEQGGTAPAVLNGANEQAVTLYLDKAISFGQITECVEGALIAHNIVYNPTLDQVLAADSWAREHVRRGTM